MEKPSKETQPAKDSKDSTVPTVGVKYMQEVDAWFDNLFQRGEEEEDSAYRKRLLNAIKTKLVESYKTGQRSMAA